MRIFLPLISLVFFVNCAMPAAPSPAACASGGALTESATVLGSVNGEPIHRRDFDEASEAQLVDNQNEQMQRAMHLTWTGFEAAIDAKLMKQAAARAGMSISELQAAEFDAKVKQPDEEAVRAIYEANKEYIRVEYEKAAPFLREQIIKQQLEDIQRGLINRLRAEADIRYAIPMPDLPRFPVEAGGGAAKGPENAKVTVVEFSDFQCPYCARARGLMENIAELYPNDVRIVYRHFPLAQHAEARPAAEASYCAQQQGKFWPYHDLLFDNMKELHAGIYERFAEELSLDMEAFNACRGAEATKKAVEIDEADGRDYGVQGTPSLFINGIKLIGVLPLPLVRIIIDHELQR